MMASHPAIVWPGSLWMPVQILQQINPFTNLNNSAIKTLAGIVPVPKVPNIQRTQPSNSAAQVISI
jgi:hypothetical protein